MFERSELRRIQRLLNYIFNAGFEPDVGWWWLGDGGQEEYGTLTFLRWL